MDEFELIRRYFVSQPVIRPDVRIPIGDDAAVTRVPPGYELVVTTDVLVAGVHFFADADPGGIGHKSLAVNLSDLAAMGAEPAWFLLDLTLPAADATWLQQFAEGMHGLARQYGVQLIGGDTSRGPLSIAITAMGFAPEGRALTRGGAKVGDRIAVTGTLGDAALALAAVQGATHLASGQKASIMHRLERPMPRVAEGMAMRDYASSAVDISDGLIADLSHILKASGVGARLIRESIPLSETYRAHLVQAGWEPALAGGDDYELCVTVPEASLPNLQEIARRQGFALTVIGEIMSGGGVSVVDAAGQPYHYNAIGHNHFA
jgi:thiamine-monophosphate kinase